VGVRVCYHSYATLPTEENEYKKVVKEKWQTETGLWVKATSMWP